MLMRGTGAYPAMYGRRAGSASKSCDRSRGLRFCRRGCGGEAVLAAVQVAVALAGNGRRRGRGFDVGFGNGAIRGTGGRGQRSREA